MRLHTVSIGRSPTGRIRDHSQGPRLTRGISVLGLMAAMAACDGGAIDPCVDGEPSAVLEIAAVRDPATGASGAALSLSDIMIDGVAIDTAIVRTNLLRHVERTATGIACTVPCSFGEQPGTYTFDVHSPGFYPGRAAVVASYSNAPAGCAASHGDPTRFTVRLVEADSARAAFSYSLAAGTGLSDGIVLVEFDDGAGMRSVTPAWPWQSFITRNSGTLHVRFVVGAPDTIAMGTIDLPLKKDWEWGIRAFIADRNPTDFSFCVEATSFPLRRAVPGADSLYIAWGGTRLSENDAC